MTTLKIKRCNCILTPSCCTLMFKCTATVLNPDGFSDSRGNLPFLILDV
jgi:hypothetical protein